MQLMTRILQVVGVKLPLKTFFENPTIASLGKYLEGELLHRGEERTEQLPQIQLDLHNRFEEFPLTDVQQAYWLGRSGLFDLGEVSVHVYSEYECPNIDMERLEQAWNRVIARHEALRLVFTLEGKQKILPETPYYTIETLDLSQASDTFVQEKLLELRKKHSHEVFNATVWPLFAIRAVKLKDTTRLYLSFDSLIVDGWSVDIVFSDWVHFYDNLNGSLPPLEFSFRDYVLGMRSLPNLARYQTDKKYWLNRIADFPLAASLPLVKTSKEIQSQTFSRCAFRFPHTKWKELQKLLSIKALMPTGFLAALFGETLRFYCNQNHFAINLTLFDRLPLHPQVNEIAGDFTSLTLLEIDHRSKHSTFIMRAQKTQQQLWQDLDHPLFNGVEFLREIARHHPQIDSDSLFPIVFTSVLGMDNKQNEDVLRIFGKEVFAITQTPQVWLDFKTYEVNGDLVIEWDFVTELFAPGFIEQMHSSFCELLQKLAIEPELWDAPYLFSLPSEQLQNRSDYNQTFHPCKNDLLHNLFNQKARSQPHHPAVISSNTTLSYEALYRKSNQIGHYLRAQGVQPNQLIAVIMEKGWEQVVGVLGILQAGSAYLPLDFSLPKSRMEELLELGEVKWILTTKNLLSTLEKLDYVKGLSPHSLIPVDDSKSPFSLYPETSLEPIQSLKDLAYVIFTSGSTGTPKGVMINHESVSNTLLSINNRYAINAGDRVLALSNLNFDLSVYDIFGLLAAGGTIVFPNESQIKEPAHWIQLLTSERITIWNTVPMFMQMLVEYVQQQNLENTLRLALLSGDWIPVDLPQKMRGIFSDQLKIVSLGGATEASVWSIYYELSSHETFGKSIPYGYPLDNQHFYVLDERMQMCPDWVTGGLFIGGVGLSRGYLNDSIKTQAAFWDHPQLGRLYNTGDLGRHVPGKGIEFLGRSDLQLKISGYRVELQEIESHLTQHGDIAQAIVSTQNEAPFGTRLVGYVIPKLDAATDSSSLRIEDPAEILKFKLKQHNRRPQQLHEQSIALMRNVSPQVQEEIYFSRKSYRRFEGQTLPFTKLQQWISDSLHTSEISSSSNRVTFGNVSAILEAFSSFSIVSYPGLKYRYPSAGSLYPVQIYLEIGCGVLEGIDGGYYYYDPTDHHLIKIQSSEHSGGTISLFLVAKLDAITPLYGSLAQDFCTLEAGYMIELLQTECRKHKVNSACFSPDKELGITLDLDVDHMLLQGVTLGLSSPLQHLPISDIYLYIKGKGWYSYLQSDLNPLSEKSVFELSLISRDNYSIYQDSLFAIFFLEPENTDSSTHQKYLLEIGQVAQKMMQHSTIFEIGTCPIGTLDDRGVESLPPVVKGKKFVHGLFGGAISKSQIESRTLSQEKQYDLTDILKNYLTTRLPKYLIPSAFVALKTFPLSTNGKVDRLALPPVHIQSAAHELIPPSNEWENRLCNIWMDILQLPLDAISVDDTFFDLGGNSLLLIQLHNQIIASFRVTLSIEKLFQYPTVRALAQFLSAEQITSLDADAISKQAHQQRLSRLAKRRKVR